MRRSPFIPFMAIALALTSACGVGGLGGGKQGTLPPLAHSVPAPAEVAANPCRYGDIARCVEACQRDRDEGTCNAAGVLFEYGSRDYVQAATFYVRACTSNYAPACNNLAWLYALGRGVPRDQDRSLALFTRAYDGWRLACGGGDPEGCVQAADMLLEGRGVEEDEPAAIALLEAACARGNPRGCARAAELRN